jgi:hypothetical protein
MEAALPETVRDAVDLLRGATAQLFRTLGTRPDGNAVPEAASKRETRREFGGWLKDGGLPDLTDAPRG